MSPRYPILVERYAGNQAVTIVCESCNATAVIDAADLRSDPLYACPAGCGGHATHKYEEADRCPGCGKLGFYERVLGGCCSRVCQLQAEYARELEARRARA